MTEYDDTFLSTLKIQACEIDDKYEQREIQKRIANDQADLPCQGCVFYKRVLESEEQKCDILARLLGLAVFVILVLGVGMYRLAFKL